MQVSKAELQHRIKRQSKTKQQFCNLSIGLAATLPARLLSNHSSSCRVHYLPDQAIFFLFNAFIYIFFLHIIFINILDLLLIIHVTKSKSAHQFRIIKVRILANEYSGDGCGAIPFVQSSFTVILGCFYGYIVINFQSCCIIE